MSKDELEVTTEDSKSVPTSAHNGSVHTYAHNEVEVSTEEKRIRARIVDKMLEKSLLDSFQYMAEIIDDKLYKELGYQTAKEYFEDKEIGVRAAYDYAKLGRDYKEYLGDPKHRNDLAVLGKSKLKLLADYNKDQISNLMDNGTFMLGDEEYSMEDLKDSTHAQLREEIKKINKKVENYEVEVEKRKNAELERDQLAKEKREMEQRDAKYRERSTTEDQIEQDLEAASKAFEKLQVCLTRIDPDNLPERMEFSLVALIDLLPKAHENFSEKFFDVMLKHNDVV